MGKIHEPILKSVASGEENLRTFDFSKLVAAQVCLDSGLVPSEACSLDPRSSRTGTGYFYGEENVPEQKCDVHVLVPWCTESNLMANDDCPSIRPVALIKEEKRSFMHGDVLIEDAKYTYRELDISRYVDIPESPPFYKYTLKEGETTGYSSYKAGEAVNGMCRIHGKPEEKKEDTSASHEDDKKDESLDEEDLSGFEVNDNGYDDTLD